MLKIVALVLLALAVIALVGIFWPVDHTKESIGAWLLVAAVALFVISIVLGAWSLG